MINKCKSLPIKRTVQILVLFLLISVYVTYINFPDLIYDYTNIQFIPRIANQRNNLIEVKEILTKKEFNAEVNNVTLEKFDHLKINDADPKSPNFGLNMHKSLHPLSYYKISSFVQKVYDWKIFFPDLKNSFQQYNLYNVENSKKYFTSLKSIVTLDKTNVYQKGNQIFATIQAKDENGKNKYFGGDVFYARIVPENAFELLPKDGIPCEVKDNLDGTYLLSAPLLLTGLLKLQVKLLLSVEGIEYIAKASTKRYYQKATYKAKLDNRETVRCNWDFFMYKSEELCDYSDPRTKEPFFCTKPSSNVCHPIVTIEPYVTAMYELFVLNNIKHYSFGEISGSSVQFNVKDSATIPAVISTLKPCKQADTFQEKLTTGYYHDGIWNSLICKNKVRSFEQMKSCFKNKSIYFLGDSTMRQFFDYLRVSLDLKYTPPDGDEQYWPPRVAYDTSNNIYLYCRAHGFPLLNVAAYPYTIDKAQYISNVLGGLKGGKDTVVVLTVGLHIFSYDPSLVINRFITIRKEIEMLNERSTGTTIIIRGQNLIGSPISWYLHRQNVIIREIMKGCKNVFFLDLWGMTNVTPIGDYHPVADILKQQSFLLSDFICDP